MLVFCSFYLKGQPEIVSMHQEYGYTEATSTRTITSIILHSSYNPLEKDSTALENVLKLYKQYGVNAHYIIDTKGKIFQTIPDTLIAYHAGKSILPDGSTQVNTQSIGIELIYSKYASPNPSQYSSLKELIVWLQNKYPKIKYILGHSEIAPDRKTDPWNFDYTKVR